MSGMTPQHPPADSGPTSRISAPARGSASCAAWCCAIPPGDEVGLLPGLRAAYALYLLDATGGTPTTALALRDRKPRSRFSSSESRGRVPRVIGRREMDPIRIDRMSEEAPCSGPFRTGESIYWPAYRQAGGGREGADWRRPGVRVGTFEAFQRACPARFRPPLRR